MSLTGCEACPAGGAICPIMERGGISEGLNPGGGIMAASRRQHTHALVVLLSLILTAESRNARKK